MRRIRFPLTLAWMLSLIAPVAADAPVETVATSELTPQQRIAKLVELRGQGSKAFDPLREALGDREPEVRSAAIHMLASECPDVAGPSR